MATINDGEINRNAIALDNLAISLNLSEGGWGIYKNTTKKNLGGRAVKFLFEKKNDALRFAEFLEERYKEFFIIWTDEGYKGHDLFQLTQYSVPHGEYVWKILERLNRYSDKLDPQKAQEIMELING